jgi:hypothetical protein
MIDFTYRLTGAGWAVATIGNERTEMTVPASYLCDAVRDFVDAVQSLFLTNSAECIWEQEPGAVRWEFRRNGRTLAVKVEWHDKRSSFAGDDDVLRFGSKVDRELDDLLATWGPERYQKEWRHAFPQEAHDKLKQAIRLERQRRKASRTNAHD